MQKKYLYYITNNPASFFLSLFGHGPFFDFPSTVTLRSMNALLSCRQVCVCSMKLPRFGITAVDQSYPSLPRWVWSKQIQFYSKYRTPSSSTQINPISSAMETFTCIFRWQLRQIRRPIDRIDRRVKVPHDLSPRHSWANQVHSPLYPAWKNLKPAFHTLKNKIHIRNVLICTVSFQFVLYIARKYISWLSRRLHICLHIRRLYILQPRNSQFILSWATDTAILDQGHLLSLTIKRTSSSTAHLLKRGLGRRGFQRLVWLVRNPRGRLVHIDPTSKFTT